MFASGIGPRWIFLAAVADQDYRLGAIWQFQGISMQGIATDVASQQTVEKGCSQVCYMEFISSHRSQ